MSRYARIFIDDGSEPETVSAAQSLRAKKRLENNDPKKGFRLACVECAQRVFVNDKKADVMQIVKLGVPRSLKHLPRLPGFSHYEGNNGVYCSLYRPNDPRFEALLSDNVMDAKERERNIAALNAPGVREEINAVQRFFMERITGKKEISPADREILDKAEKQLLSMKGLAENLWVLGVWGVLSVGARTRDKGTWEYKLNGGKINYVMEKCLDGVRRAVRLPSKMELCWTPSGNDPFAEAEALRRNWQPVNFPATPEFAEKLVVAALDIHPADVKITSVIRGQEHRQMLNNETPEQRKIREARAELAWLRSIPEEKQGGAIGMRIACLSQIIHPLPQKPAPKQKPGSLNQLDFFG